MKLSIYRLEYKIDRKMYWSAFDTAIFGYISLNKPINLRAVLGGSSVFEKVGIQVVTRNLRILEKYRGQTELTQYGWIVSDQISAERKIITPRGLELDRYIDKYNPSGSYERVLLYEIDLSDRDQKWLRNEIIRRVKEGNAHMSDIDASIIINNLKK